MKNGKSPGNDGFPVEFYKIFWHDIKQILLACFSCSYMEGHLTVSQRQGVLTLLPKPGKDTRLLKNWRPISLLNTDYKILSACIANKIKPHLPKLINRDQTGFIKGRYIGENIRTVLDVIQYLDLTNKPGMLLLLDFEKAFDSINWNFMTDTLSFLNFGPKLIAWVKLLYSDISSTVMNNGWTAGLFPLYRGVRQGCPASPYLFLLCAEILAHAIRADDGIKGVEIDGNHIKLNQYADDTSMFLDGSKASLNAALSLLLKFEKISGLKVNFDKSNVANLGSLQRQNVEYRTVRRIKWVSGGVNILGTYIPLKTSIEQLLESNFSPTLTKISNLLNTWSRRSLTLMGKVCVVKMLVIPKLVYHFTTLPNPPQSFIGSVEKAIKNFIWEGKRAKISLSKLCQDYSNGGLKLTSLQEFCESLKITWVKRIVPKENDTSKWTMLNAFFLKHCGGSLIWKGNLKANDVHYLDIKNTFLKQVLEAWCKVHFCPIEDLESLEEKQSQIIWFNSLIRISNRPVFFKKWYDKNILYVGDLLQPTGRMHRYEYFRNELGILTHFLQYCGLATAIPWKFTHARQEDVDLQDISLIKLEQTLFLRTKDYYSKLMPTTQFHSHWLDVLDSDIVDYEPFNVLHSCTMDRKLRNFQFKLLHMILPTNSLLKKMKVKDNDLCNFCNSQKDSLIHIYSECDKLKDFWSHVNGFLDAILKDDSQDLVLDNSTIVLGYCETENWSTLINFIILFAKHYIHCCYWTSKQPTFDLFFTKLKYHHSIELDIAMANNNLDKHIKKYQLLNAVW
jgi:hypothetical protein